MSQEQPPFGLPGPVLAGIQRRPDPGLSLMGQSKALKKPDVTRSPSDTDPKKLGGPNVVWVFRGSCQRWISGKREKIWELVGGW